MDPLVVMQIAMPLLEALIPLVRDLVDRGQAQGAVPGLDAEHLAALEAMRTALRTLPPDGT